MAPLFFLGRRRRRATEQGRYVMRQALATALLVAFLTAGCVHSLHPYNAPSTQSLRIQAPAPERYSIRVAEGQSYAVAPDGRVSFAVPALPRGCSTYLFGVVKVADHRAEDVPAVHVLRQGQVVRRLSLNQIAQLPVGSDSTHVLALQ
jgi:hypothetical protein